MPYAECVRRGNRGEVVGVVGNGKYRFLTEEQQPAMFFSIQQHSSTGFFW